MLKAIAVTSLAYHGFFLKYWDSIHNVYSNLTFKNTVKEGAAVQSFLANLQKVEMNEVEACLPKADIGQLTKMDRDELEAVVARIYETVPLRLLSDTVIQ